MELIATPFNGPTVIQWYLLGQNCSDRFHGLLFSNERRKIPSPQSRPEIFLFNNSSATKFCLIRLILFFPSLLRPCAKAVGPLIRLSRIQAPDGKQFYDLLARVNPAVWPKTHFPLRHWFLRHLVARVRPPPHSRGGQSGTQSYAVVRRLPCSIPTLYILYTRLIREAGSFKRFFVRLSLLQPQVELCLLTRRLGGGPVHLWPIRNNQPLRQRRRHSVEGAARIS